MKVSVIIGSLILISSLSLKAQQDKENIPVYVKDGSQIIFQANQLLEEYRDLLNVLSYKEIDGKSTEDLITHSYNGPINKLFYNKNITVEDDLEATLLNGRAVKKSIDRYLRDFDLFYEKTEESSVVFRNLRMSNVKRTAEYIYVKIDFDCEFGSRHRQTKSGYTSHQRTMEFRADKAGKKWLVYIVRIGNYVLPQNEQEERLNDVKLWPDIQTKTTGESVGAELSQPEIQELLDKEIKRLTDEFKIDQEAKEKIVKEILNKADIAFGQEDLEEARKLYEQVKTFWPNIESRHIARQLRRIAQLEEELRTKPERMSLEFALKGRNAERLHRYAEAKNWYAKAYEQKPDQDSLLRKIENLNLRIRVLSFIEAKIIEGNADKAVEECEREIDKLRNGKKKIDDSKLPLFSDFLTWKARALAKQNKSGQAEKNFKEAVATDPNNAEAFRYRALLNYQRKLYTESIADLNVYLTFDENNTIALIDLARSYFGIRDSTKGVEFLNKVLTIEPQNAVIVYEKALMLHYWGKAKEAAEAFTRVLNLNYNMANVLFYRGLNYEKLKLYNYAINDFQQLQRVGASADQNTAILSLANNYFKEGKSYYDLKQYEIAINQFRIATMFWVNHYEAWFWQGLAFKESDRFSEARKALSKAIEADPSQAWAYYYRGLSAFSDDEQEESIPDFEKAFELSSSIYQAPVNQGDAHTELMQYSLAIEAYSKALAGEWTRKSENYNGLSLVYGKRANAYFKQKNYLKALADFEECLRFNRRYFDGYFLRGLTYLEKDDYSKANDDFNRAIELGFDPGQGHFYNGEAYRKRKKFEIAVNEYSAALKREEWTQKRAEAFHQRAFCYSKVNQYSLALADFQSYEKIVSGNLTDASKKEFGFIYLLNGKTAEAKQEFEAVLKLQSADPEALFGLGVYHFFEGNMPESDKYFERAANMNKLTIREMRLGISGQLFENSKLKKRVEKIIK